MRFNSLQSLILIPHPSSLIPHPSSFILHPSSLILHPSSLILTSFKLYAIFLRLRYGGWGW
ncbi:MAG: hypothetical protein KJ063_06390 [Anaerolineae bacterium]|nr:hypothetical protein [Anaerolineae bacterium]